MISARMALHGSRRVDGGRPGSSIRGTGGAPRASAGSIGGSGAPFTLAAVRDPFFFVTQLLDAEDPVLGFVVAQLHTLEGTDRRRGRGRRGAAAVPGGGGLRGWCRSARRRGRSTTTRGARYVGAIRPGDRRRHPAALIAHMCPMYLTFAAPRARIHPVPRCSGRASGRLAVAPRRPSAPRRRAHRPAGVVPAAGAKIHTIGAAIDTGAIAPTPIPRDPGTPFRLLALGRTSPVKGYEGLIRGVAAARQAGLDVTLRIVGPAGTDSERAHRARAGATRRRDGARSHQVEAGIARAQITAAFHAPSARHTPPSRAAPTRSCSKRWRRLGPCWCRAGRSTVCSTRPSPRVELRPHQRGARSSMACVTSPVPHRPPSTESAAHSDERSNANTRSATGRIRLRVCSHEISHGPGGHGPRGIFRKPNAHPRQPRTTTIHQSPRPPS